MSLLPEPGVILGQRYRIQALIGRGGMGSVYSAVHVVTGRRLAVKLLRDLDSTPAALERFRREAQAAACVEQENIIEIVDFGVEGTTPYLVMERLAGRTLADELTKHERLPWCTAARIMLQICRALAVAHDKGVIHRDLKPQNCFLLERQGDPYFVKVLDFGIARVEQGNYQALTETGEFLGTLSYMAPEQADAKYVDARADVYAAGVILYQMLAGNLPFADPSPARLFSKIVSEPPPRLEQPDIPQGVAEIVDRALAKCPEDRHPNMRAMVEAILAVEPASKLSVFIPRAATVPPQSARPRPRHARVRWPLVTLAAGVLLLMAGWHFLQPTITPGPIRGVDVHPVALELPPENLGVPPASLLGVLPSASSSVSAPILVEPPETGTVSSRLAGKPASASISTPTGAPSRARDKPLSSIASLRLDAGRQLEKLILRSRGDFSSDENMLRVEFEAKTGVVSSCKVEGDDAPTSAARRLCDEVTTTVKVRPFEGELAVNREFSVSM